VLSSPCFQFSITAVLPSADAVRLAVSKTVFLSCAIETVAIKTKAATKKEVNVFMIPFYRVRKWGCPRKWMLIVPKRKPG
jgi:hypothetical protein